MQISRPIRLLEPAKNMGYYSAAGSNARNQNT